MFRNNCYQRSKEVFSNTFWISPNNTPWAWRTPGICDRILIIILQLTQSILTCTSFMKYLDVHYDETYQFLVLDDFFSAIFFYYFLFFPDHFVWKHYSDYFFILKLYYGLYIRGSRNISQFIFIRHVALHHIHNMLF